MPASIRDLEGSARCTPWALSRHHSTVMDACESDNERVGTPALGFFVDQPGAIPHDFGDGRHLGIVEGEKETGAATQCIGERIFSTLQLVKNFVW